MADTRHIGSVTVFISGMTDIKGKDSVDENGAKTEWDVHVVADKRITSRTFLPPAPGYPVVEGSDLPDYVRQAAVLGLLEELARDLRKHLESIHANPVVTPATPAAPKGGATA